MKIEYGDIIEWRLRVKSSSLKEKWDSNAGLSVDGDDLLTFSLRCFKLICQPALFRPRVDACVTQN